MIREIKLTELDEVNDLLDQFNYKLTEKSFNNDFLKVLVYYDQVIKGVLLYDLIYDRIEIEYIVVKNSYRRKGIASELLKYIEENNLVTNITLEVRVSNSEAINFYEKNGFKKIAIRKNYYKDEDGILMIKKLGE